MNLIICRAELINSYEDSMSLWHWLLAQTWQKDLDCRLLEVQRVGVREPSLAPGVSKEIRHKIDRWAFSTALFLKAPWLWLFAVVRSNFCINIPGESISGI